MGDKDSTTLVVSCLTIALLLIFAAVGYLKNHGRGPTPPAISHKEVGGEWHYLTPPEGSPPGTKCRIWMRGESNYAVAGVYCWTL